MAWIPALCTAIDWQVVSKFMYKFILVTSGQVWPPPQNFIHDTERYYKGSMVVLVLFYTSLWSVKISFLLFFKRLAQDLTALRIQWWVIFVFTILSYLACFADTQYWCLVAPLPKIFEKCSTDSAIYWTLFTLKFNCAMDVVTDCLSISALPIASFPQKAGSNGYLLACGHHHGVCHSPGHAYQQADETARHFLVVHVEFYRTEYCYRCRMPGLLPYLVHARSAHHGRSKV